MNQNPSSRSQRFRILTAATMLAGATALGGCNNAGEGALSGAGLGALVGMGIGSMSGNMGEGAAIGAIVGGAGGAILGDQNARNERYSRSQHGW